MVTILSLTRTISILSVLAAFGLTSCSQLSTNNLRGNLKLKSGAPLTPGGGGNGPGPGTGGPDPRTADCSKTIDVAAATYTRDADGKADTVAVKPASGICESILKNLVPSISGADALTGKAIDLTKTNIAVDASDKTGGEIIFSFIPSLPNSASNIFVLTLKSTESGGAQGEFTVDKDTKSATLKVEPL